MRKGNRRRGLAAVCACALAAGLLAGQPAARAEAPSVWAIAGARIVPVAGPVIERGTVVVRDGIIVDVGPTAQVPADARTIEGAGLTVYPGLIDSYLSVAPEQRSGQGGQQAARQLDRDRPQGFFPQREALGLVRPGARLEALRNAGITTALAVPQPGIFAGESAVIDLNDERTPEAMSVRSPAALHIALETPGGSPDYPVSLMGVFAVVRQKLLDAQHYKLAWARYERTPRGHKRPEPSKELEALLSALDGRLPVVMQANADKQIRRAVRVGREFNLRCVIAGGMEAWKAADLLKTNKVPVLVSLNFPERDADADPARDEPLRVLQARDEAPSNAARLQRAGVRFGFQSGGLRSPKDYVANAAKAITAGLPRDEALRALTIAPAEILGVGEQLGSIEKGKIANLVVTNGDLFDAKTKIRYVFVDGKRFEIKEAPQPAPGRTAQTLVDVTGAWTLTINIPQGSSVVTANLKQSGTEVTGTISEPQIGTVDIRSGSLAGNKITFAATLSVSGTMTDVTIDGTVEGDSMRGTVNIPGLGVVDFTGARPQKRGGEDSEGGSDHDLP
jgi:imidazolonepropionase-like amidohydrolase